AQKAVDLSYEAGHGLLATVAAAYDYDWNKAEKHFQLAMVDTQAPPELNMTYGSFFLIPAGRLQEAVTLMEKTVATDPLNIPLRAGLASSLMTAEMYDRAVEEARKGLEIDDRLYVSYFPLVLAYVMKGMLTEALAAAEQSYQRAPWHPRVIGILAGVL